MLRPSSPPGGRGCQRSWQVRGKSLHTFLPNHPRTPFSRVIPSEVEESLKRQLHTLHIHPKSRPLPQGERMPTQLVDEGEIPSYNPPRKRPNIVHSLPHGVRYTPLFLPCAFHANLNIYQSRKDPNHNQRYYDFESRKLKRLSN